MSAGDSCENARSRTARVFTRMVVPLVFLSVVCAIWFVECYRPYRLPGGLDELGAYFGVWFPEKTRILDKYRPDIIPRLRLDTKTYVMARFPRVHLEEFLDRSIFRTTFSSEERHVTNYSVEHHRAWRPDEAANYLSATEAEGIARSPRRILIDLDDEAVVTVYLVR